MQTCIVRQRCSLFPSLYEGFGWPPLEAMSVGCPVVCTDAGSLGEIVGNAGIVAECGDYDQLARGCERLLEEPDFRSEMVAAGHDRVQKFSIGKLAEAMGSAYEAIANLEEE